MKNNFSSLPESFKVTAKAIFPLFAIVILFILVGKFGISQVVDLRNQITANQKQEKILSDKLSILKSISQSSAIDIASITTALPKSDPSLTVFSQLKDIAFKNNLSLTAMKSVSSSTNALGLTYSGISFKAAGQENSIIAFLKEAETIAPITRIGTIGLNESGGFVTADIVTNTYWAPYPETIPTLTEPATDLTASEIQMLEKVSGLVQPSFSNLAPSTDSINTVPFGE